MRASVHAGPGPAGPWAPGTARPGRTARPGFSRTGAERPGSSAGTRSSGTTDSAGGHGAAGMRVRKPRDSIPYRGIFHSGGTRPDRPARRPTVRMFSRMRRRAPMTASAASGSSTHSAISTLTRKSLVRRSRVTSNQASQHNRVASTTRQTMTQLAVPPAGPRGDRERDEQAEVEPHPRPPPAARAVVPGQCDGEHPDPGGQHQAAADDGDEREDPAARAPGQVRLGERAGLAAARLAASASGEASRAARAQASSARSSGLIRRSSSTLITRSTSLGANYPAGRITSHTGACAFAGR